jgi:hypothetical protein
MLANTATIKPHSDSSISGLDASGPSCTFFGDDMPSDQDIDNNATTVTDTPIPHVPTATSTPAVAPNTPEVLDTEESVPLDAHILVPIPAVITAPAFDPASCAASIDTPASNDLTSATYDFLSSDLTNTPYLTEPQSTQLEIELANGPQADLISLDSPPSAQPLLPNGDEADFPASGSALEASETRAKAVPPVNDENIISDEKGKAEEAELTNPLMDLTAEHNNVIQTNATENKA